MRILIIEDEITLNRTLQEGLTDLVTKLILQKTIKMQNILLILETMI